MDKRLNHLIRYFHDCYTSDNRELTIFDFFDRKVEETYVFEGKEELLTGAYLNTIESISMKVLKKTRSTMSF